MSLDTVALDLHDDEAQIEPVEIVLLLQAAVDRHEYVEMAFGKAYAALAMGRSSRLVKVRAEEKPIFMRYLMSASDDQIFPEGGGMQIRDADCEVIGAVGVTGDTEERDEELAAHGILAAGLKTDADCSELGRRGGIRLADA